MIGIDIKSQDLIETLKVGNDKIIIKNISLIVIIKLMYFLEKNTV